ncbi:MAG TPA: tetratricopeptide repeat protein, partial [Gammaproteobacteria bacterium]|nr:tetratricopeptide repeat protein [Gammaproteobacteria bacterium]
MTKKPASSLRTTRKRADALIRSGKLEQAHELYMAACKSHPADAGLWLSLAGLDRRLGRFREAEQRARHVLSTQPDNHSALVEYGAALQAQGRSDEAVVMYRKAIASNPDCSEAHYLLANACLEHGQADLAIEHYRKTIAIKPAHIEALNNLSAILTNRGEVQASMELLRLALKIQPNGYRMRINLARLHVHAGETDKAHKILKRVIHTHPDAAEAHSKYLLCTNYLPNPDPEMLYEEHRQWENRHTKKINHGTKYRNTTGTGRPLRIGYVSPDLRKHSVAYFMEPILTRHDKKRFNITCYADVENPDDTSRRLASLCENWNWTAKLSDEQLCEKIRGDRIDILVDLAGHTGNNRLMAFARKPAPVAASYLGYPNTTGLSAIDYRLTDSIADPPGIADKYYIEKLIRLDNGFLCYQPPGNAPDCARPSRLSRDGIVFGSFNNLA